jgi:hypothetical protein
MADILRIKRRYTGGAAGAPTTLANGELAYNEVDDKLYYGKGNNAGQATSIIPIAGPGMGYAVGGGLVLTDDVAPSTPSDGTLWWDSVSGQLYIYYSDGTSNQWISTSNLPAGLTTGFLPLSGGSLTGPLSAGITVPAASYSRSIYSGVLTLVNGLGFNAYINAANTSWMRQTGTSGVIWYDPTNNIFTFNTGTAGAADSAFVFTTQASISSAGNLVTAGALATGSLAIPAGGSTKSVYSAVLNLTSALTFNIYLNTAGSAWLRQNATGTGGMFYYDTTTNTFYFNTSINGAADSTAALVTAAQLTAAGNFTVAGAFKTNVDPSVAWAIDVSSMTQKSIAAGSSVALAVGSGLAIVNNANNGSVAVYILGGGLTVLLGAATNGTWISPGTPAANQATINYVTGAYRIVNGAGGSTLLCTVLLLSNRPSN